MFEQEEGSQELSKGTRQSYRLPLFPRTPCKPEIKVKETRVDVVVVTAILAIDPARAN